MGAPSVDVAVGRAQVAVRVRAQDLHFVLRVPVGDGDSGVGARVEYHGLVLNELHNSVAPSEVAHGD